MKAAGPRRPIRSMFAALTLLILLPSIGCHKQVGPNSGRIKFTDGSPVMSGRIEFRSLQDDRRFVSRIDSQGRFFPVDLDERPGLPPGNYEVVVVQMVLTEDLAAEDHHHGTTVPRRYADYYTSDLRVEVSNETREIEISLEME